MIPQPPDKLNASLPMTLGILAGGSGHRMGSRDKGLVVMSGRPLATEFLEVRARCSETVVCCVDNAYFYRHLTDRVLCDLSPNQGPVAGVRALLTATTTPLLLVCPVDLTGLSVSLISSLYEAIQINDTGLFLTSNDGQHCGLALLRCEQVNAILEQRQPRSLRALFDAAQLRAFPTEHLPRDIDQPEDMVAKHHA